ncbi:RiPP maturation radical SAM protein 1, partial [Candidatus Peregrinibacteria bacterium]|nr:RiPP maturation radical SAM protein 1 [Candidatus Peregrinibacteria bacterium]
MPSISAGILKSSLSNHGISSDVHYLNLRFAKLIGLPLYRYIADEYIAGEWFFSRYLFRDVIANSLSEIKKDSLFRRVFLEELPQPYSEQHIEYISKLIVPKFLRGSASDIEWGKYKVIGFTTNCSQNLASLALAKLIKESHPKIKIIFGGSNVHDEMGHELLRSFPWVDAVVDGNGEYLFPLIVKKLIANESMHDINGVSFRSSDSIYISSLPADTIPINHSPLPDYTDYFNDLEVSELSSYLSPSLLVETSRGCWWGEKSHCTFCGLNTLNMGFRSKEPKKVIKEIISLVKKYRINDIEMMDNILDLNYFQTMFPRLRKKKINLSIFLEVRANLTYKQVSHLKETGVLKIQPGIESLSTHVLKLMRKGTTALQNVQLLKWCKERGIKAFWNLIYGFPGEKKEDYRTILSMAQCISHLEPPAWLGRVRIDRFSPYYFQSDKFGIIKKKPMNCYEFLYPKSVDLNKLAYYFDYRIDEDELSPEQEITPAKDFINRWRQAYKLDPFLTYLMGPNFIKFYDYRIGTEFGIIPELRKYEFDGFAAKIYDFCKTVQSYESILIFSKKMTHGRGNDFEAQMCS